MRFKKSVLEPLNEGGVILGDGSMVFNLERRGYVHAGRFTPEVVLEHPDAVRQLHREYVNSGADVLQALTFFACEANLRQVGVKYTVSLHHENTQCRAFSIKTCYLSQNKSLYAGEKTDCLIPSKSQHERQKNKHFSLGRITSSCLCEEISNAACRIAKDVAEESDREILVAGCMCETFAYTGPYSMKECDAEFEVQVQCFIENDVDFVIAEYFRYIEEMCWAIEALKKTKKPVVAMMNIGGMGDRNGVSTGDCAVAMAKAGADVIGLNCCFGPDNLIEAMKEMKEAIERAGLRRHLICLPLGFLTPDAGKDGYLGLPEYPFALEPRSLTRFDARKFARNAYEAGVKYIGGCCNFEAYHIREMAAG
ncbi:betaine--homocysteine S-methyltransferase 1-like [Rhopilema esculentum]|uniref:betaine--homocysteine S-methyltransferase 1-like n=1 Tax=Rhopilema esculentum TaxID=499914 RepID=UPI0031DADBCC